MGNCRGCGKDDSGCVYVNATCVRYNTELPEWSVIESCSNIEETTKELYDEVTVLREPLTMSCDKIDYNRELDGRVKMPNAIKGIEESLCSLLSQKEETIVNIFNLDITQIGLDFKCLQTPCGDEITTLKDLLQSLINKACP